ncbi:hypothetical protein BC938DRAFT_472058 [Jimgerdemannia flammicorona]|uniref:RING-type E3 ubiquitin transferase n=1 Tax=Jimgerdemannia flammicorona TaxID=994334 RepID=A0A433Q6U7_9FUNG|nr:hypothetical protein BC938DRAFT_472058 [Jimgerdemannia flammicorona]
MADQELGVFVLGHDLATAVMTSQAVIECPTRSYIIPIVISQSHHPSLCQLYLLTNHTSSLDRTHNTYTHPHITNCKSMSSPIPGARSPRYWCHQCTTEIDVLMAPDPTCPICNRQFVEQIEDENDPRTYIHEAEDDEDSEEWDFSNPDDFDQPPPGGGGRGPNQEMLNLLQNMLQSAMGQNGTITIQTVPLRGGGTGGGATMFVGGTAGGGGAGAGVGTGAGAGAAPAATAAAGDGDGGQPAMDQQIPLFNFLQQAFGTPGAGTTGGGATGGGGGLLNQFFNMVGNPNDYVFSQAGLDNIVSQLMEQAAA